MLGTGITSIVVGAFILAIFYSVSECIFGGLICIGGGIVLLASTNVIAITLGGIIIISGLEVAFLPSVRKKHKLIFHLSIIIGVLSVFIGCRIYYDGNYSWGCNSIFIICGVARFNNVYRGL